MNLFSSRHLLTHTLIHTLRLCVGVPADALMQKRTIARGMKISAELAALVCLLMHGFLHVLDVKYMFKVVL